MAKVLDLFAGLEGWSAPFRRRGHEVFSVDWDKRFDVDLHVDIRTLNPRHLPFRPDVILASPPCESFSMGSNRHHWRATTLCEVCGRGLLRVSGERWEHISEKALRPHDPKPGSHLMYAPKSTTGLVGQQLLRKTIELIRALNPAFYVIENPLALMRKMPEMRPFERRTVTYCRYGKHYRKPTDLWGKFPPSLRLREPCDAVGGPVVEVNGVEWRCSRKTGKPCHEKAERGSRNGAQGLSTADAGKIPYQLALAVCRAVERDI